MSESIKATRATVAIGALTVDAFMLPDGSYRMSLSQAANSVGKEAQGISNFLRSKALKRLLEEAGSTSNFLPESLTSPILDTAYSPDLFIVELSDEGNKGQTRIRGVHLEIVGLYWQWECLQGNKQAFALATALTLESLERRFDNAFGVVRSEQERNDATTARIKSLESDLANLGEGFAIYDDIRRERDFFESLLKQNGLSGAEKVWKGLTGIESQNETRGIKRARDEILKFLNKRSYTNAPPISSATRTTASMAQAKR